MILGYSFPFWVKEKPVGFNVNSPEWNFGKRDDECTNREAVECRGFYFFANLFAVNQYS